MPTLLRTLAALLLVVAGLTVASTPAAAAPCSPASGYVQGWDGTNTCSTFQWSYWQFYKALGECHSIPANVTSYIWNNTGSRYTVYTGAGCSGTSGPIYARSAGAMTGVYNNNLESMRRNS